MLLKPLILIGKVLWFAGTILGATTAAVAATNWLSHGRAESLLTGFLAALLSHVPWLGQSGGFEPDAPIGAEWANVIIRGLLVLESPGAIIVAAGLSTASLVAGYKLGLLNSPRNSNRALQTP